MGFDLRSSLVISSDPREEPEAVFRGGEPDPLGMFEPRHCAAWEGTVTTVLVVF